MINAAGPRTRLTADGLNATFDGRNLIGYGLGMTTATPGGQMLDTKQYEIVETAKKNLRRAIKESEEKNLPDAGERWGNYCSQTRLIIERLKTAQEVVHYVQNPAHNTGFETRPTGEALVSHAISMDGYCALNYPDFKEYIRSFAETPMSLPETTTTLNGRLVSAPLLWHMRVVMAISRLCRPRSILEIGGGYGAPARVWMTNQLHCPDHYIDVDFPESLFFTEVYLRLTLPECAVLYIHGDTVPATGNDKTIMLCPIAHYHNILADEVDLTVNTGSMQEMSDEYVSFYMDAIQNANCDNFFSFNYFNQRIERQLEGMNSAAPVMGEDWSCKFRAYHHADMERGGTAEMFFSRTCKPKEMLRQAEAAVRRPPPSNGSEFLELFDDVRGVDRADLLIEAAASAVLGMPYVPREALWLARKVPPTSYSERAFLHLLQKQVAGEDVSRTLDGSVRGHLDGGCVFADGLSYPIAQQTGGSLEGCMEMLGAIQLAGWAGDLARNLPVDSIVASVNGELVRKTAPIGRREDIEAGYGNGIQPTKFTMKVPLPADAGQGIPVIRVFGLTSDRKALPLSAAGLPAGTIAQVVTGITTAGLSAGAIAEVVPEIRSQIPVQRMMRRLLAKGFGEERNRKCS
jgi:putative sugar O-methyltransferase